MFKIKLQKKYYVFILVFILIIFIILKSCGKDGEIVYEYAKVEKGIVEKTISVSGKLELIDSIIIKSEIPGEIIENNLEFNTYVKKGQLLVKIKSEAVDADFNSFKNTYTLAKNDLENSRQFLAVQKKLYNELLISKKEYDDVKLAYDRKYSYYKDVLEQYNMKLENVKKKNVYSPVDGIIIQNYVEKKSEIGNNTPLILLTTTLKKMKLVIIIDEADISYIKRGQELKFMVSAYPDKLFSGKIEQVGMNPITKQNVVSYEAFVECENTDEFLKPGMTVTATVEVDKKNAVLRVPTQALLVSPVDKPVKAGEKFVWIKDRQSDLDVPMRQVKVTTGILGDTFAEITSGKIKVEEEVLIGVHTNAVK